MTPLGERKLVLFALDEHLQKRNFLTLNTQSQIILLWRI